MSLGEQTRQLDEPQRVTGAHLDQTVPDALRKLVCRGLIEEQPGRVTRKPFETKARGRRLVDKQATLIVPHACKQSDSLAVEPAADETEHLLRRDVGPLRIVDDDNQRSRHARPGEQSKRCGADRKNASLDRRAQLHDAAEQLRLASLELVELVTKRPEDRLQGRERNGLLGLYPHDADDMPATLPEV